MNDEVINIFYNYSHKLNLIILMKLTILLLITTAYTYTIVRTLDIDLDGPARQRFQPAVQLLLNTYGFDASFGAFFSSHNETTFKHLT